MIEARIDIKTQSGMIIKDGAVVETCTIMDLPSRKNLWIAREVMERMAAGTLEPIKVSRKHLARAERREAMGR